MFKQSGVTKYFDFSLVVYKIRQFNLKIFNIKVILKTFDVVLWYINCVENWKNNL